MFHNFFICYPETFGSRLLDYTVSFNWNHLCQRIPRGVLEVVYGINIVPPQEGEDPNRAPHAEELLSSYGCKLSSFSWFIKCSLDLVKFVKFSQVIVSTIPFHILIYITKEERKKYDEKKVKSVAEPRKTVLFVNFANFNKPMEKVESVTSTFNPVIK